MSYDTKCLALAIAFLVDYPELEAKKPEIRKELAQHIQDAIEEFLQEQGV